ncbi:hypothetical protein LWI29_027363 [Acer saccharum]|uniref:Myb/SANT-like domain-containing protein n=1 Tax=Acer saccharum TaxID=4024 RepID=A0AA39RJW9_ACESA|nr:hypothetical protein LWI29_027363 [Acer saccharum]
MMSDKIPGCELRAQQHIDSRIKLLKKQYHAISEMLGPSASGFGWNDDINHPIVKGLRNKPFPYYEELGTMFGNDRANGQGAMGFSEMIEEIGNEDDQHNDDDPFYPSDELNVKEFGNMQTASDSIRRLVDCFQFETDGATRRMKVFDELKKIDGMTNAQRVKVGQLLVHDQANIDYFFNLDEEFKLDFLLLLLE